MSHFLGSFPVHPPCGEFPASKPESVFGIGLPKAYDFDSSEFLKAFRQFN